MNFRRLVVGAVLAAAALAFWAAGRPAGEPGAELVDWRREPLQEPTDQPAFILATRRGELTVVPRYRYDIAAYVLGAERYRFDDLAFLSPVDLALAWGDLAEPEWRRALDVSQSWRFYFWRADSADLDAAFVISHSANTHVLPANANVRRALLALGRGDEVRLRGLLVDIRGERFRWTTSTVRTDHGDGGCEVLWVEQVDFDGRTYR